MNDIGGSYAKKALHEEVEEQKGYHR